MNEKVKVRFIRFQNVLSMEVLEMPEKYRGKGALIKRDNCYIASKVKPEIYSTCLCLRGDQKEYDNTVDAYVFHSEQQAMKRVKVFSELIHELNERDAGKSEETESDGGLEITIAE